MFLPLARYNRDPSPRARLIKNAAQLGKGGRDECFYRLFFFPSVCLPNRSSFIKFELYWLPIVFERLRSIVSSQQQEQMRISDDISLSSL